MYIYIYLFCVIYFKIGTFKKKIITIFSLSLSPYEFRIYPVILFHPGVKPLPFSRSRRKALAFNRSHISNLAVANAGTDYPGALLCERRTRRVGRPSDEYYCRFGSSRDFRDLMHRIPSILANALIES